MKKSDKKAPSGVSALPWKLDENAYGSNMQSFPHGIVDVEKANFIVHAVNNHAGLVDVIEKVLFEYKHRGYITNLSVSVMKKALKNAKWKK